MSTIVLPVFWIIRCTFFYWFFFVTRVLSDALSTALFFKIHKHENLTHMKRNLVGIFQEFQISHIMCSINVSYVSQLADIARFNDDGSKQYLDSILLT